MPLVGSVPPSSTVSRSVTCEAPALPVSLFRDPRHFVGIQLSFQGPREWNFVTLSSLRSADYLASHSLECVAFRQRGGLFNPPCFSCQALFFFPLLFFRSPFRSGFAREAARPALTSEETFWVSSNRATRMSRRPEVGGGNLSHRVCLVNHFFWSSRRAAQLPFGFRAAQGSGDLGRRSCLVNRFFRSSRRAAQLPFGFRAAQVGAAI